MELIREASDLGVYLEKLLTSLSPDLTVLVFLGKKSARKTGGCICISHSRYVYIQEPHFLSNHQKALGFIHPGFLALGIGGTVIAYIVTGGFGGGGNVNLYEIRFCAPRTNACALLGKGKFGWIELRR